MFATSVCGWSAEGSCSMRPKTSCVGSTAPGVESRPPRVALGCVGSWSVCSRSEGADRDVGTWVGGVVSVSGQFPIAPPHEADTHKAEAEQRERRGFGDTRR